MDMKFSTWLSYLEEFYGDREAITCGTYLTYYELLNASRRCALILNTVGVKKGDKVVLWSANGVDFVVSFFGIVMSGGVAVLMNYGYSASDITKLTKKVEAQWAIIGTNRVSAVDNVLAINAVTNGGVQRKNVFNIDVLMKEAADYKKPFDNEAFDKVDYFIKPKDTQVILFTSEHAGSAKAVELSSYSILSNVNSVSSMLDEDVTETLCDAMPLYNCFGLSMMLTWLNTGNQVYLLSDIKPQGIMDVAHRNNITGIAAVSAIYSGLVNLPDFEFKLSGQLKTCLVGDSFTTPTEMLRFENSLKNGKFLVAYGQAECSSVITFNISSDPVERRASSAGRSLPGEFVYIWRLDSGYLEKGEIGEIVVKGANVMNGYFGLPSEEQPFDADGWLHTGVLGVIDEFGLLHISGRIKDIIVRNGEKINPLEIEKVIMEDPSVSEAKVFGAPHPIWGESIEACIVPGKKYDPVVLKERLGQKLPFSKIPSHFIEYSSFAKDLNGKTDMKSLKADLLVKIQKMSVSNILDEGQCILSLKVENKEMIISPICDMVQSLTEVLKFKRKQANRIRLAVEEMLTERIINAYEDNGEITIDAILMPEWLRIRFVDSGKVYSLDDDNASLSAKIILANVDAYSSVITYSKLSGINLDWQYSEQYKLENM